MPTLVNQVHTNGDTRATYCFVKLSFTQVFRQLTWRNFVASGNQRPNAGHGGHCTLRMVCNTREMHEWYTIICCRTYSNSAILDIVFSGWYLPKILKITYQRSKTLETWKQLLLLVTDGLGLIFWQPFPKVYHFCYRSSQCLLTTSRQHRTVLHLKWH